MPKKPDEQDEVGDSSDNNLQERDSSGLLEEFDDSTREKPPTVVIPKVHNAAFENSPENQEDLSMDNNDPPELTVSVDLDDEKYQDNELDNPPERSNSVDFDNDVSDANFDPEEVLGANAEYLGGEMISADISLREEKEGTGEEGKKKEKGKKDEEEEKKDREAEEQKRKKEEQLVKDLKKVEEEIRKKINNRVKGYSILFKKPVNRWTNFTQDGEKKRAAIERKKINEQLEPTQGGNEEEGIIGTLSTLDKINQLVDAVSKSADFKEISNLDDINSSKVDAWFRDCFRKKVYETGSSKRPVDGEFTGADGATAKAEVADFLKLIKEISQKYNLTIDEAEALAVNTVLNEKKEGVNESLELYRVQQNKAFLKARARILGNAIKSILVNTTSLTETDGSDREKLNDLSKNISLGCLINLKLKHNIMVENAKKNPAIAEKFDGAQPIITSNNLLFIGGLTNDQREIVRNLDINMRNPGAGGSIAVALGPGEGKSFMVNTVIPGCLDGTYGEPIYRTDKPTEQINFTNSEISPVRTIFINLVLTDLYRGITKDEAQNSILTKLNEKLKEFAGDSPGEGGSDGPPSFSFVDGRLTISGVLDSKYIVLAVDEYHQLPEPVFSAVNKLLTGLTENGLKCQLMMVSATPNISILKNEMECGVEVNRNKADIEKYESLRETFTDSLRDFHILGTNPITGTDEAIPRHRLGLIGDDNDMFKNLRKDLSQTAYRTQLLLPDVNPEDLESIANMIGKVNSDTNGSKELHREKLGLVNRGIRMILFRDADNKLICLKMNDKNEFTISKDFNEACLEKEYNPAIDGRVLMLYSKSNCVGGDFGKFSVGVEQQMIYSNNTPDIAQIKQYTARNRRGDMTKLDKNTDLVIRTSEAFSSNDEFIEKIRSLEALREARAAVNYSKNELILKMKKNGFKDNDIKALLQSIKKSESYTHLGSTYCDEIVRHLKVYELALKNEENLVRAESGLPKKKEVGSEALSQENMEEDSRGNFKIMIGQKQKERLTLTKTISRDIKNGKKVSDYQDSYDMYSNNMISAEHKAREGYQKFTGAAEEIKEHNIAAYKQTIDGVNKTIIFLDEVISRINEIEAAGTSGDKIQYKNENEKYFDLYTYIEKNSKLDGKLLKKNIQIPSTDIRKIVGYSIHELKYFVAHGGNFCGDQSELRAWSTKSQEEQDKILKSNKNTNSLKGSLDFIESLSRKAREKKIGLILTDILRENKIKSRDIVGDTDLLENVLKFSLLKAGSAAAVAAAKSTGMHSTSKLKWSDERRIGKMDDKSSEIITETLKNIQFYRENKDNMLAYESIVKMVEKIRAIDRTVAQYQTQLTDAEEKDIRNSRNSRQDPEVDSSNQTIIHSRRSDHLYSKLRYFEGELERLKSRKKILDLALVGSENTTTTVDADINKIRGEIKNREDKLEEVQKLKLGEDIHEAVGKLARDRNEQQKKMTASESDLKINESQPDPGHNPENVVKNKNGEVLEETLGELRKKQKQILNLTECVDKFHKLKEEFKGKKEEHGPINIDDKNKKEEKKEEKKEDGESHAITEEGIRKEHTELNEKKAKTEGESEELDKKIEEETKKTHLGVGGQLSNFGYGGKDKPLSEGSKITINVLRRRPDKNRQPETDSVVSGTGDKLKSLEVFSTRNNSLQYKKVDNNKPSFRVRRKEGIKGK
ncbi:MAG: hypothetical protein LBB24_02035 [Rickettsiales bacterium]|jgi:hypothetical protein|nr:hypothetical protein [Rickettsiales bacterium]